MRSVCGFFPFTFILTNILSIHTYVYVYTYIFLYTVYLQISVGLIRLMSFKIRYYTCIYVCTIFLTNKLIKKESIGDLHKI